MHPQIDFPGKLGPLLADLSRPMFSRRMCDPNRTAIPAKEASLVRGYVLDPGNFVGEKYFDVLSADFRQFMSIVMNQAPVSGGYPIRLERGAVAGKPENAVEAHRSEIASDGCELLAEGMDGLRRALFRLQDEMLMRRAPILPLSNLLRWTQIRTRIVHSPVAPYRWLSGWELEDEHDYYPDAYLNRLAHRGINGIWVAGLLRNLVASKSIPELGPREHRLGKLNQLIEKAARYGIRVYLFCIEPRALPARHPAAAAHPDILGAHNSLCTSVPLVREYIREVMQSLFTESPALGGIINIFCGERATNCWLDEEYVQDCPRCRRRPKAEVLAETLDTFVEGIRAAGSSAEFMAWTYMMATSTETLPIAPMLEVARAARKDVIWLGNFEHGTHKTICGKPVQVHEYSLSCIGPSPHFSDLAKAVRPTGREIYAKLQVGTSYEMSSVPHIPVPGIVYDKIAAARELGATGAMLGWIPGGFPTASLRMAGEGAFEPRPSKAELMRRIAAIDWGETGADAVVAAWNLFADAWQQYPFHNAVLYWGPITRAPAYQLHLEREPRLAEPYNWGYTRNRRPQPFEDQYKRWLGFYTVAEITGSFREMARTWRKGIELLESAAHFDGRASQMLTEAQRQIAEAKAVRLQCLSAANVYEFYALRDKLKDSPEAEHPGILQRMEEVAREELQNASEMIPLMKADPAIGFESEIYDYSYSLSLIDQKLFQIKEMLPILERWRREGIDRDLLNRTVEEADALPPEGMPDRWGD
jgi:hypothetical protein